MGGRQIGGRIDLRAASRKNPVQTGVSQRSPLAESAVLRRPAGDFASFWGIINKWLNIPAQIILDQQTIHIFPSKSSSDAWKTSSPRAGVRLERPAVIGRTGRGCSERRSVARWLRLTFGSEFPKDAELDGHSSAAGTKRLFEQQ